MTLTATIVLFRNDIEILKRTIDSFLSIKMDKKLFLVDNSPTDILRKEFNNSEIEYKFVGQNLGFGAANNLVLDKLKKKSLYHLVLNPDVTFNPDVITNLIKKLKENSDIGVIAPKVNYPDGSHQFSCRRFPTFFDLIVRRLGYFKILFSHIIDYGEYKDKNLNEPFYVDYVSGCFQLFKTEDFLTIKGFDTRYFMYMEDIDICKKIIQNNMKVLYYPNELIIHNFEKGSSKNIKLFFYHISSILKYFYKWEVIKKK